MEGEGGPTSHQTLLSVTLTNEDPIDRDMICDNLASVLCLPKLRELHLEGTHLDYLGRIPGRPTFPQAWPRAPE